MNLEFDPEVFSYLVVLGFPAVLFVVNLRNVVRSRGDFYLGDAAAQPMPLAPILCVTAWFALMIGSKLLATRPRPQEISLLAIQVSFAMHMLLAVLLPALLLDGGKRTLPSFGIYAHRFGRQAAVGAAGFLAAVCPTAILLLLSRSWRTEETQHPYLQALRGDSGGELVVWIILSAVIAAPLAEELLFRVTLQGWLTERLPAPAAIGLTVAIFTLVHGWRDALPLVPLSLILGYIFHQTRSYWSCVVTHALFNAANLTLALLSNEAAAS